MAKIQLSSLKNLFKYSVISLLILLFCIGRKAYAQDKSQQLKILFDTLAQRKNFNGCVMVVEQGNVLFQSAYGSSGDGKGRLLTNQSVFEIGSITKAFTAIAIMQLKDKGLLNYDDSLANFLPSLTYPGVTIRHLLSHTSGIEDFLSWGEQDIDISKVYSNADIIRNLSDRKRPPLFPAGRQCSYSNTNYLLLATIVEVISNMPFENYLASHIFQPCGMQSTRVYSRNATKLPADFAYDMSWDAGRNELVRTDSLKRYTKYMSEIKGAYGIMTTTDDLYRWSRAISNNVLLKESTFKEATSPFFITNSSIAELIPGLPYAAGWSLIPDDTGYGSMFSSGNYGGYTALIVRKIVTNQTVIMLSNSNDTSDLMTIMGNVDDILDNGTLAFPQLTRPKTGVRLPASLLKEFVGKYKTSTDNSQQITIALANNQLYIKADGATEQNLFAESENVLFANEAVKLIFQRVPNGKVEGFKLAGTKKEEYFKKFK
jgi:CubicO group peptidase (beta-lactamase class C family)